MGAMGGTEKWKQTTSCKAKKVLTYVNNKRIRPEMYEMWILFALSMFMYENLQF